MIRKSTKNWKTFIKISVEKKKTRFRTNSEIWSTNEQ